MKQYRATHKRNGKKFVIQYHDNGVIKVVTPDGKAREVKESTVRRWYVIGEEIKPEHKKLYWYAYRFRGFSPGCQPRGFVKVDESYGKFGAVAYERPLTDQEIDDYELEPIVKEEKRDRRKKVTADQVREIRRKYRQGAKKSQLAREYGLSYSGVHWIVNGNTWAYLEG